VVLRHLRRLRGAGPGAADGDGALLQRFVTLRDEAAFTELLARHGPMVLGVCRRLLGEGADVDDAFQATFLVLVQKAASVRNRDALGSWLYGVALRVARKARAETVRRRALEKQAIPMQSFEETAADWRDLRPVLDAELERLPAKYREPLILCYLEGHSYEEAARRLGWSNGTVCGRLARAKDLLRGRLARRGLAPVAALLTAGLGREATAAVPTVLADATLKSALACAGAGGVAAGAVAAPVAALTKGALNAMFWGKIKGALLVVLVLSVVAAGAGGVAHQVLTAPPEADKRSLADSEKVKEKVDVADLGDPLPAGALLRLGTARMRHEGYVTGVAFSADGKTVIAAGNGRKIHFWDAVTGKEVRTVEDVPDYWDCLALSPDGKLLALSGSILSSGPRQEWVSLRDAGTGREIRRFAKGQDTRYQIAFSPDSKSLATASNGSVMLWDVTTGKKQAELSGLGGRVYCLAYSPDGKLLAAGGEGKTVRFFDPATGKEVGQCLGHDQHVSDLAFSPDGKTLVTASYIEPKENQQLGVLKLWDVAERTEIAQFEKPGGHVMRVAFSPDGKTLASAGADNTVRLWDVATRKQTQLFVWNTNWARQLVFSPDSKTLAAAVGNRVRLWDVAMGKEPSWYNGHRSDILFLAYSPDGKTLASRAGDPTICVWDVRTGKELHRLPGPLWGTLPSLLYSPDGKTLGVISGGVRLWDLATGKDLFHLTEKGKFYHVAFAPAGNLVAVSDGERLQLLSSKTGEEVRRLGDNVTFVENVSFSPDGKFLATAHGGPEVRLWDVATGKELQRLERHSAPIRWLSGSEAGPTLLSVLFDKGLDWVQLWDAAAAKETSQFQAGRGENVVRAVSTDGRILAAANHNDSRLELWDVTAGRQIAVCQGPPDLKLKDPSIDYWFNAVSFAPDDRTLVTMDLTGRLQLWESATGQELRPLGEPSRHRGLIDRLAFSPDGRTIASGDGDTILIWDVTGRAKADGLPRIDLKPKELDALWDDLTGAKVPRAHEALWKLVAAGDPAVAFLRQKLLPKDVDARRTAQLIADLDSDTFEVREKATRELETLGLSAEASLRQALAKNPGNEVRRRIEVLLEKIDGPRDVQLARVLQVVEQVGTPEARQFLEDLAKGPRETRLSREARATLQRVNKGKREK
jgi:RNA polymerase sigma factor (sigma-70 family)